MAFIIYSLPFIAQVLTISSYGYRNYIPLFSCDIFRLPDNVRVCSGWRISFPFNNIL